MTLEGMIERLGLVAVFVGAATEGDLTLVLTGVAAQMGLLNLTVGIAVGALGGFAGDAAWYALGRHRAVAIRGTPLYRRAAPTIDRFIVRLGPWQILLARFLYGTRVATMLFWGIRGLPFWRFAAIDMLACVLWATTLGSLGFLLSGSATVLLGNIKRVQIGLLVVLVAVIGMIVVWKVVARLIRARA